MEWSLVEDAINKEINFLKRNLALSPYRSNDPIKCSDCLFRKISILIVSGVVSVQKIEGEINNRWPTGEKMKKKNEKEKMHGSDWHHGVIKQIEEYFKLNQYEVIAEPSLHYGRADLGVPRLNLYVEIGSIGLYKLYLNLLNMKNCDIIVEPFGDYVIKFSL